MIISDENSMKQFSSHDYWNMLIILQGHLWHSTENDLSGWIVDWLLLYFSGEQQWDSHDLRPTCDYPMDEYINWCV